MIATSGLVHLQATPGNGGGEHDRGSSRAGEHEKGPKGNQSSKSGSKAKSTEALLAQNSKLSSKLQGLLPEGTDIQQASAGFKNLGQFVAAVHVSRNLGIPFDRLKAEMVDSGASLGQAIHTLRPGVNSEAEAKKAQQKADQDLEETS